MQNTAVYTFWTLTDLQIVKGVFAPAQLELQVLGGEIGVNRLTVVGAPTFAYGRDVPAQPTDCGEWTAPPLGSGAVYVIHAAIEALADDGRPHRPDSRSGAMGSRPSLIDPPAGRRCRRAARGAAIDGAGPFRRFATSRCRCCAR